jgi:hypothetical protein
VKLYLRSSNTPSWRGAQLQKAHGQLYLLLSIIINNYLQYKINEKPRSAFEAQMYSFRIVIPHTHKRVHDLAQWTVE